MSYLTLEQIKNAQDLQKTTIDVPEWGGKVGVKQLSIKERDELNILRGLFVKDKGGKPVFNDTKEGQEAFAEFRLKSVAFCLCNEKGERLFSEADIEELGKKSPAVIDKIFEQLGNAFKTDEAN